MCSIDISTNSKTISEFASEAIDPGFESHYGQKIFIL